MERRKEEIREEGGGRRDSWRRDSEREERLGLRGLQLGLSVCVQRVVSRVDALTWRAESQRFETLTRRAETWTRRAETRTLSRDVERVGHCVEG